MKFFKTLFFICTLLTILLIDFISKTWITDNYLLYESKYIISIFNLYHIHNYGGIFGILSTTKNWKNYFLNIMSSIILFIIFKKMLFSEKKIIFPYILIISGAIGNLFNRICYGFVIDFIDIHVQKWHFATFNIADISIFIGIVLLLKYDL